MQAFRVAGLATAAVAAVSCLLAACSDDERPVAAGSLFPPRPDAGQEVDVGQDGGGDGGQDGDTPQDGAESDGETSSDAPVADGSQEDGDATPDAPADCGNGVREGIEPCDGEDFGTYSCASFGFSDGSLGCTGTCELELTGCSGAEGCVDGLDNDGDGLVDCGDDDCAEACADPCVSPVSLADPGTVQGQTHDHAALTAASCMQFATESGPEVIYELTPAVTGALYLRLQSLSGNQSLSVRTACVEPSTEAACSDFGLGDNAIESLSVPVQQGVPVFVVVDSSGADGAGSYELFAASRPIVCGDANRDPGEACDDGNSEPGDGCSATCTLEADESEPNEEVAQADSYVHPFTASIDPAGDVDVVSVIITQSPSTILAHVFDLGDGACSKGTMDPLMEVLGTDGSATIVDDNNSGAGLCPSLFTPQLPAGTYYVRVSSAGAAPPTFPYRLDVTVDACGNGNRTGEEQCDDGNTTPGDGCSATCTTEN